MLSSSFCCEISLVTPLKIPPEDKVKTTVLKLLSCPSITIPFVPTRTAKTFTLMNAVKILMIVDSAVKEKTFTSCDGNFFIEKKEDN